MSAFGNNLNFIKEQIHLPGLSDKAQITRVAFYRRKPRGFSNGHYLYIDPARYLNDMRVKRRFWFVYAGCWPLFIGIIYMQQYRKTGKSLGSGDWVPPYYNDSYLEAIGKKSQ